MANRILDEWNSLYSFLPTASLIACVILLFGMLYFLRQKQTYTEFNDKAEGKAKGNAEGRGEAKELPVDKKQKLALELLWNILPLIIFFGIFTWGWLIYYNMQNPPKEATEIHVLARNWSWNFQYLNGKSSTNELVIPINTPIKLIMASQDVLHSFYVPSFRLKQQVVPGQTSALWFQADKLGEFLIFCTEFCGSPHSEMAAKIRVVNSAEYQNFLKQQAEAK